MDFLIYCVILLIVLGLLYAALSSYPNINQSPQLMWALRAIVLVAFAAFLWANRGVIAGGFQ